MLGRFYFCWFFIFLSSFLFSLSASEEILLDGYEIIDCHIYTMQAVETAFNRWYCGGQTDDNIVKEADILFFAAQEQCKKLMGKVSDPALEIIIKQHPFLEDAILLTAQKMRKVLVDYCSFLFRRTYLKEYSVSIMRQARSIAQQVKKEKNIFQTLEERPSDEDLPLEITKRWGLELVFIERDIASNLSDYELFKKYAAFSFLIDYAKNSHNIHLQDESKPSDMLLFDLAEIVPEDSIAKSYFFKKSDDGDLSLHKLLSDGGFYV